MNLFDCLKDIIVTKKGDLCDHPDFNRVWSNYMIARYLSMDTRFFEISQTVNRMQLSLPSETVYKFLVKNVPKQRSSYIKYITKPKAKKD
jgi:hypothetical protein